MRFRLKHLFVVTTLTGLLLALSLKQTVTVRCDCGPLDLAGHQGIRAGEIVNIYGKLPSGKFASVASKLLSESSERIEWENGCTVAYFEVSVPYYKSWKYDNYTNYAVEFVSGPYSKKIGEMDMLDILNSSQ